MLKLRFNEKVLIGLGKMCDALHKNDATKHVIFFTWPKSKNINDKENISTCCRFVHFFCPYASFKIHLGLMFAIKLVLHNIIPLDN